MTMSRPKRLGVTLAKSTANVLAADERRIPDDEIGVRPFRPFRVPIAPDFDPIAFAIGAFERLAALVPRQLLEVPGKHGVHDLDRLEVAQDWLGRSAATRAEMP